VLAAAGCGSPARCKTGFIGDRSQPVEIAAVLATDGASQILSAVKAGDPVPLEPPPQGGYVMYVGAQVRNLDACGAEIRGSLRDPVTDDEIGFDARTTNLVLGADGWGRPDPSNNSNVSNVNGCPDYTAKDVQNQPYNLRVTVVDRSGRSGSVTLPIRPTCDQIADPLVRRDCVSTCSANYVLGKCGNLPLDGATGD
jgi:hypothetical protein